MAQQGAAARKSGSGRSTSRAAARAAAALGECVLCLRLGRVSAAVHALAHDSHDVMMTRDDRCRRTVG